MADAQASVFRRTGGQGRHGWRKRWCPGRRNSRSSHRSNRCRASPGLYAPEALRRVHPLQNWSTVGDPVMVEALYEIASPRLHDTFEETKAVGLNLAHTRSAENVRGFLRQDI